ncbi:MAG: TetR/AcrR family transcriptional regulator [Sulfurovum sp.]|nr:TetR/AcrR family transcriptional regulator [Sulfurovum sp.]MCB4747001.1 TetR/AcrR family transcriptional regulator [Sulfurovum sp.]MCB4748563.1 TetR/AcrR family transcriptional regulator [Sulfurovum sp.]MCB4758296.1 TetR/AcrR family transcriptional regulator [Sulfurovum sp.]MCB4763560.1 TetR/AcrR family transcriptional regulator [Sulfurovum sp.]
MKAIDKKALKRESIIQIALQLFSLNGFHKTTIPDIAQKLNMSVGNLYNYFSSKNILAQEIIKYTSEVLGEKIREINMLDVSAKEKIYHIVEIYFNMAKEKPEMIEYFLRVYLSNREVFSSGCEGMICVSGFITEIMIFFDDAVGSGELRNQDFFSAFGLFMGYLGGMVFLKGEEVLPKEIECYIDDISCNIYNALKVS